jgi:hypothetical protein
MQDTTAPARYSNGRFGPGNPGRRAGARNQISHRAVMAILEDFELNEKNVLVRLRNEFTPAYFAVLTRLLDRQLQVDSPLVDEWSDAEAARVYDLARRAVTFNENPRTALIDLEGALGSGSSLVSPAPAPHQR